MVVLALAGALAGSGSDGGGAAPASARSAPGAALEVARPVRLVIEANGDLLIHSPIYQRALALGGGRRYDFSPMLREIRPYVAGADLAICHVETPMAPGPPHGYPLFNTPPDLARAIRATGWDACDTASNHSLDGGQRGVDATGVALARAGVGHTGSFASAAAQRRPLIMTVKGVRVALLAYTEMTNGIPLPHPWSVNLASAPRILVDARRARRAGAQVVIVNVHWGLENQSAPTPFQRRLARSLTASPDITAVIGRHVHVVQPIEPINGRLVVFGEGNLLSNQTAACCPVASQDGLLALLDIVVDAGGARLRGVRYVPIRVRHPDFEVLPVGVALKRHLDDAASLRASYRRTVAVAGRRPGVEPVPAHLP